MKLGKTFAYTAPTIELDLGIPALGLQARFTPQITLYFGLNFGFGVDSTPASTSSPTAERPERARRARTTRS